MSKRNLKLSSLINDKRIYIMFGIVFVLMAAIAPNFLNLFNIGNILKGATLCAIVAVGFTVVLITGYLDLSVGSVINLGAVMVIAVGNKAGLAAGILAAVAAGMLVGLVNGLFVTKGKIHAFIVTLGMLSTIKGLLYMITGSASINIKGFQVVNFMESRVLWLFTPKVLITLALILIVALVLARTRTGRVFFLMGGNRETAWFAGYNTDNYAILSFVISAGLAAVGGVLFALSAGVAVPNMGEKGLNPAAAGDRLHDHRRHLDERGQGQRDQERLRGADPDHPVQRLQLPGLGVRGADRRLRPDPGGDRHLRGLQRLQGRPAQGSAAEAAQGESMKLGYSFPREIEAARKEPGAAGDPCRHRGVPRTALRLRLRHPDRRGPPGAAVQDQAAGDRPLHLVRAVQLRRGRARRRAPSTWTTTASRATSTTSSRP